ncbi:hypothetical protein [Alkalibacterium olivapovliticus]|uniref:Uncharacterized protein n=1 Tax=Alkalibacterium olivapovliticus TaxID=99907 RepID=A0A2T0WC19_9LACT|nr:hypothetical protein [Alkalibacterium olivapovliticus]PRY84259.1 hypothetical protein CLV38_101181 [Alkalibacterium olivapovliticus]
MNTEDKNLHIELQSDSKASFDLDRLIYDFESDIDLLSSHADSYDYLVSIGSGILSGLLDTLWVGDFSLERGRNIASDEVDTFVIKMAKLVGCEADDLQASVRFLENKFPTPSDGNTSAFGGSLQHHLRDFAHHPSIVGLMFSLLTQFTNKSYGTNNYRQFIVLDVLDKSKAFIGDDVPSKISKGTITWFFHLVSDMAGSSHTAGNSGGTGIPGPLLSLAKELSILPIFKNITIGDTSLSELLSKLFNGTLLAQHDDSGTIIKNTELRFDLRSEMGLGIEIGRQTIPVIANECIVRSFYFIRRLALEIKENDIQTISDLKQINWEDVRPYNNPTVTRMLTIATGVFTTIDVGDSIITQKYWVSINYMGVGRFAVAIGEDVTWCIKSRKIKEIRNMYKDIQQFVYEKSDDTINKRIGADMTTDNFGLTVEQTEILYNLEYYKTLNDIRQTKTPRKTQNIKLLKHEWLKEWKHYISKGFSSFLQIEDAELHWYTEQELIAIVEENAPQSTWFRLILLEVMLFEPYYPLGLEKDKNNNDIPSKKYKTLQNVVNGYKKGTGDDYIDAFFSGSYYPNDYIQRLRKSYNKVLRDLNEVLKTVIKTLSITSAITILAVVTAGAFAPSIAVALVGSNFAGLSGASLTAASLAYLGGGAVAVGGAGMAGGTIAVVGGGAFLGIGLGAGVGTVVGTAGFLGKRDTILQSEKLLVSVREIFLNDEHDTIYSNTVYEQYVQKIMAIEKGIVELKHQADDLNVKDKKKLLVEIKNAEESAKVMIIAKNNMKKFISSFEIGLDQA